MGTELSNPPPAVDFVDKNEGVYKLLEAIRLALSRFDPVFEQKLLRTFSVEARRDLPQKVLAMGAQESVRLFHESAQAAAKESAALREREQHEVARLRYLGWWMRLAGFAFITIAFFTLLFGATTPALASMAASLLMGAIKIFFSRQEEQATERENKLNEQLQEQGRISFVLTLCDTLETPAERDLCRKQIIERLLRQPLFDKTLPPLLPKTDKP